MSGSAPPNHIRDWYAARVKAMTPAQRSAATEGVADFNEHDWRAFYELHQTFRIDERTRAERSELETEEQRMLRKLPKVERNGIQYDAPWSWGVRVAAARNLWGEAVWSNAKSTAVPLERWES